jgi:hypothetical protein
MLWQHTIVYSSVKKGANFTHPLLILLYFKNLKQNFLESFALNYLFFILFESIISPYTSPINHDNPFV